MIKIIVTNTKALRDKYKSEGLAAIKKALKTMVAEDKVRGIKTRIMSLDSKANMKSVGAKALAKTQDAKGTKRAIDRIYSKIDPDYLMILGAPDVVPHVDLKDATKHDTSIPSDLPYACKASYSDLPEDFVTPSRVIGRLPDEAGSKKHGSFVKLIRRISKWQSSPASDYDIYFGLSARAWKKSTELSLKKTFGNASSLKTSPPRRKPTWPKGSLAPRAHFINCHGSVADPNFYGDPGGIPATLNAATLEGEISSGCLISAECCYGALLYDQALSADPSQASIPNTYLNEGAWGFFGSTGIAYGPAEGNGYADVICQQFLKEVRAGASLGRAALQSKLDYIRRQPQLNPFDLKTLAEFTLLGDPSVHPVAAGDSTLVFKNTMGKSLRSPPMGGRERRLQLASLASALGSSVGWTISSSIQAYTKKISNALNDIAAQVNLDDYETTRFETVLPNAVQSIAKAMFLKANENPSQMIFHLLTPKSFTEQMKTGSASSATPKNMATKATGHDSSTASRAVADASWAWPKLVRSLSTGKNGASPSWPKSPPSARVIVAREINGKVVDWEQVEIR